MESNSGVSLDRVIKELSLEQLVMPRSAETILITVARVNRPGLPLTGFYDYFEKERIEIIGKAEHLFLERESEEDRRRTLEAFFSHQPVAVVLSTGLDAPDPMVEMAEKYGVPLMRTQEKTSNFMAGLIAFLNMQLAPKITHHGVLVEVYGEGVLLLGDSGIGKSETAIELVKRGHRLIADDAVEIKRISPTSLVGQAPELIRHYVELRGIGIVDVRRLFGMGAVKEEEEISLIINMEPWQEGKMYDRLGIDEQKTEILGIEVPSIVIPVRPGRNLSIIIEVAAMNLRLKKLGHNTAQEFNRRLMESMGFDMNL
ncbi:MAG: HPr(Ser) kinase/phosphatase [Clostridia bacterium]|nr:HPr(Ser) kinase/phosphatase [Clostridia bacterium]MDY6184300.1 HPr(Ser) kinase/phosphatase [Eubacteriales bacterium]